MSLPMRWKRCVWAISGLCASTHSLEAERDASVKRLESVEFDPTALRVLTVASRSLAPRLPERLDVVAQSERDQRVA
jgi:hypothetical protein